MSTAQGVNDGVERLHLKMSTPHALRTIWKNGYQDDETPDNTDTVTSIDDARVPSDDGDDDDDAEIGDGDAYNDHYSEWGGKVARARSILVSNINRHKVAIGRTIALLVLTLYFVYFGFSMNYKFGDEGSIRLVWGTCLVLLLLGNQQFGDLIYQWVMKFNKCRFVHRPVVRKIIRWAGYIGFLVCVTVYLGFNVLPTSPRNFVSLCGILFFVVFTYIVSVRPDMVNWHAVFWGIATQVLFALFILRTTFGYGMFNWLGTRLENYMRNTDKGSVFVFGKSYTDHQFVFRTMPLIIFMSSTVNVMYHYGILQWIVKNFGQFLLFCMGTSAVESVNAAFNMFLGPSESPMAIKPFLPRLTSSEMHAVMTATFSSISGSVFGMLVNFGAPANHLLTASVMSAPAALAMAKLMMPETRRSRVLPEDAYNIKMAKFQNVLEAISVGAVDGIDLVGTVVVNNLVFIAAIAFVDTVLIWFGARIGVYNISFEIICSYLFYPLAYVIGFPSVDLYRMGELLGIKIFANSFVGFLEFGKLVLNRKALNEYVDIHNGTWHWEGRHIILDDTNVTLVGGILDKRSEVLGTYAFCGLNHIGAIGVGMGTLLTLCPQRKKTITKYVLRANITGQMACFMTACIAGLLYDATLQSA